MNVLILVMAVAFMVVIPTGAQAATDGTYALEGGSYAINVKFGSGTLTILEPNKTSVYNQREHSNEYLYTNPTNNITYGLRVVDDATLQAFKPGPGNVPTTLRLRHAPTPGEQPPKDVAEAADAIADRYFELSASDPINAQTWTQCAAAAMTRSTLTKQQADETEIQAATLLKMIAGNRASSPCPDAISEAAWRAAPSY
jgi:hypothetical protein